MAVVDIRNRIDLQMKECSGQFYIYCKIDFAKTSLATANDYKIARVGANWLYKASYFRMPTDSTSAGTVDVGTTASATDLDSAIDVDAGSQTAWTAMTPTDSAPVEQSADGYIYAEANAAAIEDGVLELMIWVQAAPNEDSKVG
jgi:hypothetical protein